MLLNLRYVCKCLSNYLSYSYSSILLFILFLHGHFGLFAHFPRLCRVIVESMSSQCRDYVETMSSPFSRSESFLLPLSHPSHSHLVRITDVIDGWLSLVFCYRRIKFDIMDIPFGVVGFNPTVINTVLPPRCLRDASETLPRCSSDVFCHVSSPGRALEKK